MGRPEASIPVAQVSFSNEWSGPQKLAIGSVKNIEKTIPVGLQKQVTCRTVLFLIDQDRSFIRVVIVEVMWRELEVPFHFSSVRIKG